MNLKIINEYITRIVHTLNITQVYRLRSCLRSLPSIILIALILLGYSGKSNQNLHKDGVAFSLVLGMVYNKNEQK